MRPDSPLCDPDTSASKSHDSIRKRQKDVVRKGLAWVASSDSACTGRSGTGPPRSYEQWWERYTRTTDAELARALELPSTGSQTLAHGDLDCGGLR